MAGARSPRQPPPNQTRADLEAFEDHHDLCNLLADRTAGGLTSKHSTFLFPPQETSKEDPITLVQFYGLYSQHFYRESHIRKHLLRYSRSSAGGRFSARAGLVTPQPEIGAYMPLAELSEPLWMFQPLFCPPSLQQKYF